MNTEGKVVIASSIVLVVLVPVLIVYVKCADVDTADDLDKMAGHGIVSEPAKSINESWRALVEKLSGEWTTEAGDCKLIFEGRILRIEATGWQELDGRSYLIGSDFNFLEGDYYYSILPAYDYKERLYLSRSHIRTDDDSSITLKRGWSEGERDDWIPLDGE